MGNNDQQEKDATSSLTFEQLRDLLDLLRRPLTDRSVFIPLGPQAFVPGRLQPRQYRQQRHHENGQREDVSSEESTKDEIVSVLCGGILKDMTRTEARAYFQTEMDRFQTKKPAIKNSNAPPQPLPPVPIKQQQSDSTDGRTEQKPQIALFDIREELNNDGQEVRSEAINVSHQLKEWEEQVRQAKTANGENTSLTRTPEGNTTAFDGEVETMDENEGVEKRKEPVSDQEYELLLSRLDELARLEEEAEKEEHEMETVSLRSRLKPQTKDVKQPPSSSGWAKGFLNKKTTTKQSPISQTPTQSRSNSASTKQPQQESARSSNNTPSNTSLSSRKVGFSDQTQVQEIPRVGERAVSDIQKRPTSKAIEGTSLFSGLVQERKATRKKKNTSTQQQQQQQAQEKPLSRFAQERLGEP